MLEKFEMKKFLFSSFTSSFIIIVIVVLNNVTFVTPTSTHRAYCPSNGQLSFDGEFCWYIDSKPMDFRNAERYCIDNYGGHLASIHNIYGNMLITGIFMF